MSTIALVLTLLSASLLVAGICLCMKLHHQKKLAYFLSVVKLTLRKLTVSERAAVQSYLHQQDKLGEMPSAALSSSLSPKDDNVYCIVHAITRYGWVSNNEPSQSRYCLNTQEIHPPPFWEQYISANNHVEMIKTQTIPLVISLNACSLHDNPQCTDTGTTPIQNAAI